MPLLEVPSGSVTWGCTAWTRLVPCDPGSAARPALTRTNQPPSAGASHAPRSLTCPAVITGLCWYPALCYRAATRPLQKENKTKQEPFMQLRRLTLRCQGPEPGSGRKPLPLPGRVRLALLPLSSARPRRCKVLVS